MRIACYHCGETVLTGDKYQLEILGNIQSLCCPGCQSVAQTIVESGLVSYYQYRTSIAVKSDLVPEELKSLSLYDNKDVQSEFVINEGELQKVTLSLDNVSCAACAWLIEKHLLNQKGIQQIQVNTTTHRANVVWHKEQIKLSQILDTLHQLGYKASPFEAHKQEEEYQKKMRHYLYKLGVAGIATMQVMMIAVALYLDIFSGMEQEYRNLFRWVSLLFATPVLLYSASPFYLNAWRNIKAKTLGMDIPVTIALLFAYLSSCYATITQTGEVYFESISMFAFFLLIGRYLELRAKHQAAATSANLLSLVPKLANLTNGEQIAAKSLRPEMLVRILPGESIPADGVITEGMTSINESMLTGESLPVTKTLNDHVYAGTINIDGNIDIKVTTQQKDSLLSQIVRLQDDALLAKPKLVLVADKVAKVFVAFILMIAALTWLYWQNSKPEEAFWIMLSVLVATCPCALSLATPTALTCAISSLSRLGIVVKNSHVFETLPKINHILLDKTGTLTQGKIKIKAVELFCAISKKDILNTAAALERYSNHPIAKAFEDFYTKEIQISHVQNHIGQGIRASIDNNEWRIGSAEFALDSQGSGFISPEKINAFSIWLSCDGKAMAGFKIEDPVRDNAKDLIKNIQNQKIKVTMLTGDNSQNASFVAEQLAIKNLVAGVSPEGKMQYLKNLDEKNISMMIGDGVNDAPVLASAHLSLAMGSGTDIAKSSADMVLLTDDLTQFLAAQSLAKKTQKIIKQNLAWALGYNGIILPLAVAGMVSPYIAVIGMSASSVIVVVNSLRIYSAS